MAILRNRTQDNFTIIDNEALKDERLSLKAVGLLCRMLSLPDNWDFSEKGLCAIFKKDGLTSIRSGLKELEDAGYLRRQQIREKGRFTDWEWEVFSDPYKEKPKSDFPKSVNPKSEITSNKELNKASTKESNTKRDIRRFAPPSIEEVRAYCIERGNNVNPQRFIDHYESNGWMVGRSKMKDWRAAVRTWESNAIGKQQPKQKQERRPAKNVEEIMACWGLDREVAKMAFDRKDDIFSYVKEG